MSAVHGDPGRLASRTRDRRGTSLLLALLLVVSAQAALAVESQIHGSQRGDRPLSLDTARTARSFYLALDTVYSSGSLSHLDSILAEEFVDHATVAAPGQRRSDLIEFALLIHEAAPGTHVRVTSLAGAGDLVQTSILVASPQYAGQSWSQTETLLVRKGMVAERWRATFPFPVRAPVADVVWRPLDWDAADLMVVAISTMDAGGQGDVVIAGPALIWVSAGEMRVGRPGHARERISPASPVTVANGARIALSATSDEVEGWIVLARPGLMPPGRYEHAESAMNGASPFERAVDRASTGGSWRSGAFEFRLLCRAPLTMASDRLTLALDRWLLPPLAALPWSDSSLVRVLIVQTGVLSNVGTGHTVSSGDALVLSPGEAGEWQSGDDGTVIVESIVIS